MPLYEYQCQKTGKRFEVIQKFSDEPLTICPDEGCDGRVKRLLSAPAIRFKGSGWYVNDYAKSGSSDSKESEAKSDSKADKRAKDKSDSKSGSKSESKSESKPEKSSAPSKSKSD